jgi:hypothetical protein
VWHGQIRFQFEPSDRNSDRQIVEYRCGHRSALFCASAVC